MGGDRETTMQRVENGLRSRQNSTEEYAMGSPVKDTAVLPPAQRVPPMPVLTSMKDDPDRLAGAAAQEQSMLSAWGATFVCSNACIGAGVLAFPNVFANGGLITTFVLMFLIASLEYLSLDVLVKESQILGVKTYQQIVQKLYGSGLSVFFSCIIFSYMFGALSAYLIIIGDVLTDVASRHLGEDSVYASYSFAVIVWGGALLLPLSLKRNFSDLQFVSFISISSLGYLLVAVCIRSLQGMADKGWHVLEGVNYFPRDFSSLMNAVPVIGFAFVCHLQICEIARELNPYSSFCGGGCCGSGGRPSARERSDSVAGANETTGLLGGAVVINADSKSIRRVRQTMSGVMVGALCVCGVFYGTIGSVAYLSSPQKWVKISDLLQGYGVTDSLMEVGRVALVMNISCSFPINLGPARSALVDIFHRFVPKERVNDGVVSAVTTILIVSGAITVALSVRSLGVVFKIIGGTVGALLIFLLPGLMITSRPRGVPRGRGKRSKLEMAGGVGLLFFGAALFVCTVVSYFT